MRYRAECYFAAVCPMFAIKNCFLPLQLFSQEFTGVALGALCYLLGSAGAHHVAAGITAFASHVDNVVGTLYDVDIVLDDNY